MGTQPNPSHSNETTLFGRQLRKDPQPAETRRKFPRSARVLKASVMDAARSLYADGDQREISTVIARRLGLSEATVDRILTAHALAGERYRRAYEVGVRNAAALAQQAAESVWKDLEAA